MTGRTRSTSVLVVILAIGVGMLLAFAVSAADAPADSNPIAQIREVPVGKAQLASWLERGWQPVLADEYRKLAASARAGRNETSAWISRVEYSATVVGGTLREGKLTAEVKRNGPNADLMLLDPLNVALSELKWSDDAPLVWGSAPDGGTKLLVDRSGGKLEGRWDFSGKAFSRGYRFDLRVAPAAVTSLQLRIPDGLKLISSVGQISGPTASEEKGWQQWVVQLGSETACRLSVFPDQPDAARQPMLFVNTDVSNVLRQDGLQVLGIFDVEVLEAPVSHFEFVVPADFRIYSVSYGKDESIAWKDNVRNDRHEVIVDLPEPLLGRSRSFRIAGMLPRPADEKWKLPALKLRQANFLTGQLHLRVEAPMELQSFEKTEGFRRDTTTTKSSQGRSYMFRRLLNDAEMIVSTGSASLDLGARVVNHFDTTGPVWKLQSEIEWIAHGGSTYTVRCGLPPQWQITGVSSLPEDAPSQIKPFGVKRSNDGSRVLLVEFIDSLALNVPKVVRVECERTPAGNEQLAALPVLQPQGCGVVDSRLIISHNAKTVPKLEAGAPVEPIDEAALPDFVTKSSLWRQMAGGDSSRLLLNVKSAAALQTGLTIDTTEPSIDAAVDTSFEMAASEVIESFVAKITPKMQQVGRVLVYLSRAGPRPNWEIASATPATVSATLIPLARHAEWSLPARGELWELLLSAEQDREFRIKGSRKSPAAKVFSPGLMFIPNSDGFAGTVHFNLAAAVEAEVATTNLREFTNNLRRNDDGATVIPTEIGSKRRRWKYDMLDASLEITTSVGSTEDDAKQFASLSLRTIVDGGGSGIDVHTATFHIVNDKPRGPFRFTIPSTGTLLSMRLNDRVIAPAEYQSEPSVVLPQDGKPIAIDVQYYTQASSGLLLVSRPVPIPETSAKILSCDWAIASPRDLGMAPTNLVAIVDRLPGSVPWPVRFFGPIGRAAGDGVFNPFSAESWRREGFFTPDDRVDIRHTADAFPPAGFDVVRANIPWAANDLMLRTWSIPRARIFGCLTMFLAATLVLALRRRKMANESRLIALWLTSALILAMFVPPVFAPSIGGIISGMLLAVLLPHTFVFPRPQLASLEAIPLGSTAKLGHSSLSLPSLLFVGALIASACRLSAQTPAAASSAQAIGEDGRTVLVPVTEPGAAQSASLVFIHRELLEELRRVAAQQEKSNEYLIESAEYRGAVDDQSLVSIDAEFRVAVLSPAATTRIVLPLTNANLGGTDACLVNGKPHPVFAASDQSGYELDLAAGKTAASSAAQKDKDAASKNVGASTQSARDVPPEFFTVRLKLRPATTAIASGARMQMKVPAAASGRLALTFANEYPSLAVAGSVGEVVADRKTLSADLGKGDALDVSWSSLQRTAASSSAAEATVSCLVEVHPTWLDYKYRVDYRVRSGQIEHMAWQLPARSVVRAVTSKGRNLDHAQAPSPNDRTTLFIDLPEPQRGEFSIDANLIVPLQPSGQDILVPAPDILAKQDGIAAPVNQIGIVAPSEFLLTARTVESEHVARVSADSFVAAASRAETAGSRTPLFAYRLQSASVLSFDLALQPTLRKVRQSQVGRIGAEDVTWTYTAEVETTGSPAFEHTLVVDRSLRIESITVQEDKAGRLAGQSRNNERVHLFLSDATTGTQQIELRGRMPLRLSAATPLPLVRLEDARVVDSTLTLTRQPEVAVELTDTAALEPIESAEKRRPEPDVLVGQFREKPNAQRPQIQVIRRSDHTSVDTATVVSRKPEGDWVWTTVLRFKGSAVGGSHYRVQVPAEVARTHQLRLVNAESRSESREDGSIELNLTPTAAAESAVTAIVSAPITPPSGSWQLPRVTAVDAAFVSNYLLISPGDTFEPDAKGVSSLLPEAIPQWIRDAGGSAMETGQASGFTGDTGRWTLKKRQIQTAGDSFRIPLCTSQCWLQQDGRLVGRMEMFAVSTGGRGVTVRWPDGAESHAIYVDGNPTSAEFPKLDELAIALQPSPKAHVVVLLWSQQVRGKLPVVGTFAQSIPQPVDARLERSLCTVIGPQNSRLVARKSQPSIGELEYSVTRLEGLVAALWESGSGENVQRALWELITQAHAACIEGFDASGDPKQWSGSIVALHERLQTAEEETKALRGSVGTEPPQDALAIGALERFGIAEPMSFSGGNILLARFEGSDDEAGFTLWIIDNRLVAWVVCALAISAVGWMVWKLGRRAFNIGLSERPAASWAVLGLLWWLCLANSALGLVLILLAVYFGLSQRRRGARSRWQAA